MTSTLHLNGNVAVTPIVDPVPNGMVGAKVVVVRTRVELACVEPDSEDESSSMRGYDVTLGGEVRTNANAVDPRAVVQRPFDLLSTAIHSSEFDVVSVDDTAVVLPSRLAYIGVDDFHFAVDDLPFADLNPGRVLGIQRGLVLRRPCLARREQEKHEKADPESFH